MKGKEEGDKRKSREMIGQGQKGNSSNKDRDRRDGSKNAGKG
jgi:hypothetical protein